jgi:hypothetical protein
MIGRDRLTTFGNLFQVIVLAVVIGLIFFDLPPTYAGIQSRKSFLYNAVVLQVRSIFRSLFYFVFTRRPLTGLLPCFSLSRF